MQHFLPVNMILPPSFWGCLDLESISGHTGLVLLYQGLAVCLRGIIGFGEEHAVVAGGLFFFADTAWLSSPVIQMNSYMLLLLLGG
jgi:hypothetical protein